MSPSVLNQDQTQLSSKVLFTYGPSSVNNERRSLTPPQLTSNIDVREINKRIFYFEIHF
jgi:hypothetical protein